MLLVLSDVRPVYEDVPLSTGGVHECVLALKETICENVELFGPLLSGRVHIGTIRSQADATSSFLMAGEVAAKNILTGLYS